MYESVLARYNAGERHFSERGASEIDQGFPYFDRAAITKADNNFNSRPYCLIVYNTKLQPHLTVTNILIYEIRGVSFPENTAEIFKFHVPPPPVFIYPNDTFNTDTS